MNLKTFSRIAHKAFRSIPEEFKEGVDGLTIRAERVPHPTLPDIFTMGQCLTESYPSDWSGPETLRSVLVLYHGSFKALAARDQAFDWLNRTLEYHGPAGLALARIDPLLRSLHEDSRWQSLLAKAGMSDADVAAILAQK